MGILGNMRIGHGEYCNFEDILRGANWDSLYVSHPHSTAMITIGLIDPDNRQSIGFQMPRDILVLRFPYRFLGTQLYRTTAIPTAPGDIISVTTNYVLNTYCYPANGTSLTIHTHYGDQPVDLTLETRCNEMTYFPKSYENWDSCGINPGLFFPMKYLGLKDLEPLEER